jgi:pimeloyl-ACP methyl ester carboxylesterase
MRALPLVLGALAALAAFTVLSGALGRFVLSIRILDELRRPGPGSLLRRATPPPRRSAVTLAADGRRMAADRYDPAAGAPGATLLLVPGAVEEGKDDPRVAPFAELLARAGFRVLVPELTSFRTLRAQPENVRELAAAVAAAAADRELAPRGRVGVFGISYAGAVGLLVALDPRLADRVGFVAAVGAYADLDTVARFLATGTLSHRGRRMRLTPDPYGRLVFLKTYEEFLRFPEDRTLLEEMAARRLGDPQARLDDLAAKLTPEGRPIFDLFERAAPEDVPRAMERLAGGMTRRMAELSPARRDFAALKARLYLVHDREDGTIPFTESHRLAALARPHTRVRLVILESLHHVDPEPWSKEPARLLARELPEAWRLAAWWRDLLVERGR